MLRAEPKDREVPRDRSSSLEVALVAGALIVMLTSFSYVVEESSWFVSAALVTALVTVAVIVMRLIGLRRLVAPLALLVELAVVGWIFVPSTLMVVIPTPETISGLATLANRAGSTIINEQAPVPASQPVVFAIAASFGLLVIVADLALRTRWAPALIGLLLLAVYLTPSVIVGRTASPWVFGFVAVVWLALMRLRTSGVSERMSRQVPAVAMGLTGIGGALLFPSVAPNVTAVAASWGAEPPQVFGRGINPMIELGASLRRNSPVTVLTYTTELEDAPYLKVATLTDFTGETWRPANDYSFERIEGRFAIDPEIDVESQSTSIQIEELRSQYLPVPYPATQVSGYEGRLRWVRTGQTLESVNADSQGQSYDVTSLEVQPTADQLRAADGPVPADLQGLTELVVPSDAADAMDQIAATAAEVTADAETTYDKVKALEDYLRSSEFEYSESAPVADDYDGNGLNVLSEFLDAGAGYCVHFSSAMAVMARSLDIPARIAVGYTSGSPSGLSGGERTYRVSSDNLHAWTEIYFDGVGWVRFDPTPSVGRASDYVEEVEDTGDEEAAPAPAPEEERGESPQGVEGAAAVADEPTESSANRSALAVLAALFLILGLPAVIRSGRRWWRLRSDRGADPPWREVQATARDLGIESSVTQTPRAFAQVLRTTQGVDPAALDEALTAVERARFSQHDVDGNPAEAARQVTASMFKAAPRRARLRARLLPRSLARST